MPSHWFLEDDSNAPAAAHIPLIDLTGDSSPEDASRPNNAPATNVSFLQNVQPPPDLAARLQHSLPHPSSGVSRRAKSPSVVEISRTRTSVSAVVEISRLSARSSLRSDASVVSDVSFSELKDEVVFDDDDNDDDGEGVEVSDGDNTTSAQNQHTLVDSARSSSSRQKRKGFFVPETSSSSDDVDTALDSESDLDSESSTSHDDSTTTAPPREYNLRSKSHRGKDVAPATTTTRSSPDTPEWEPHAHAHAHASRLSSSSRLKDADVAWKQYIHPPAPAPSPSSSSSSSSSCSDDDDDDEEESSRSPASSPSPIPETVVRVNTRLTPEQLRHLRACEQEVEARFAARKWEYVVAHFVAGGGPAVSANAARRIWEEGVRGV